MDHGEMAITDEELSPEVKKQAETGKKTVRIIVIISFFFLVIDLILRVVLGIADIWSAAILIFWSVVCCELYVGKAWARWLYVIIYAFGFLVLSVQLIQLIEVNQLQNVGTVIAQNPKLMSVYCISLPLIAVQLIFCILLVTSKNVHEFFSQPKDSKSDC